MHMQHWMHPQCEVCSLQTVTRREAKTSYIMHSAFISHLPLHAHSSRVFLLGPSHHFYSKRCLLSRADAFETPLGPLEVDIEVCTTLRATGQFDTLEQEADEVRIVTLSEWTGRAAWLHHLDLSPVLLESGGALPRAAPAFYRQGHERSCLQACTDHGRGPHGGGVSSTKG
jgi:hypothetical protein